MRVGAARRLDDDLAEPDDPREQRPGRLHRLDPLERHLPVLAEQDPRAQLDLAGGHAEAREPPRHPAHPGHHGDDDDEGGEGEDRVRRVRPLRTGVAGHVPGDVLLRVERAEDGVEELAHRVAEHREQHDPAAQQGREGVQPLPVVGRARPPVAVSRHRPARWASPRAARRARSASASSVGQAGQRPAALGRGGVDLARGDAEGPGQRPGLDVDVLEAPVGHADEGAEEPTLADDDLLVELDPRDGRDLAADQPQAPEPGEDEGEGGPPQPGRDEQGEHDGDDAGAAPARPRGR